MCVGKCSGKGRMPHQLQEMQIGRTKSGCLWLTRGNIRTRCLDLGWLCYVMELIARLPPSCSHASLPSAVPCLERHLSPAVPSSRAHPRTLTHPLSTVNVVTGNPAVATLLRDTFRRWSKCPTATYNKESIKYLRNLKIWNSYLVELAFFARMKPQYCICLN